MSEPTRRTHRSRVIAGAVIGTFLSALDVTVVGTAMPTIVGQLGGLSLYPWVFSIYLLTSTVTVPLYGKGADLYGRRPMYGLAVGIFVLGSVLAGSASSMLGLILFRALQGVGAGGLTPVTQTIVGDLYPAEERAKVQGLFSSVWAMSSIAGPGAGALMVSALSWRWIFWINLPLGAIAAALLMSSLHENVRAPEKARTLDLGGAVLLTAASSLLMWALIRGGEIGFGSAQVIGGIAVSIALGVAFAQQERRHREPMIPPQLFEDRVIRVSAATGVLTGILLYGITSYVPPYVEGALGGSPADAGIAVMPFGLGWPIAAFLSGRALRRFGYRRIVLFGAVLLAIGAVPFFFATGDTMRWLLPIAVGFIGVGLGFSSSVLLIATQEVVTWNRRGAATALIQFTRTIGGAVGVAAMGAVLSAKLNAVLGDRPELLQLANQMLDPHTRAGVPPDAAALIGGALGDGLQHALHGIGIAAALSVLVVSQIPGDIRRPTGDTQVHLEA